MTSGFLLFFLFHAGMKALQSSLAIIIHLAPAVCSSNLTVTFFLARYSTYLRDVVIIPIRC